MTPETLHARWLELVRGRGIGPVLIKRLVAAFHTPQAVLCADAAALHAHTDLTPTGRQRVLEALASPPSDGVWKDLERLQQWGGRLHLPGTHGYPESLWQMADPPGVLYSLGRGELVTRTPQLAVVGSRRAGLIGLGLAKDLGAELSRAGVLVISGLALGIDAAAHRGALDAGQPTLAVLGCGLDVVYPPKNADLRARILEQGCLLSEMPPGMPVRKELFPYRNRILVGLARGVLVVEASLRSGAMITARLAAESGRDVFAVPGPARAELSAGPHWLLRQGARLVEHARDILDEWPDCQEPATPATLSEEVAVHAPAAFPGGIPGELPEVVWRRLGQGPVSGDELARCSSLTVAALSRILLQLELSGLVRRLPGNHFVLNHEEPQSSPPR
ncbi:MAG: DNA-processing protein DprA [Magnetococcus sp. WYHC-3]